jgi:trans-aconitate methyltransferase
MAGLTGSIGYMAGSYVDYQKKYRASMRQSDRVLLDLIAAKVPRRDGRSLLDLGCHNGNFLYHVRRVLPGFTLTGVDLYDEVLAQCRADPDLDGISFAAMDLRALTCDPADVVVASAVLSRFSDAEHAHVWAQIASVTKPGGLVAVFDWYNPFNQTLRIIEETAAHPEGLVLNFRAQSDVRKVLERTGFRDIEFRAFEIPIDLPLPDTGEVLTTHTIKAADGSRLQFRGALYQPWTHLTARRA